MSKEPKTFKAPKEDVKVLVKTWLPWVIIFLAVAIVLGFILGSQYQIAYNNDMNSHAQAAVSALKEVK